MLYNSIIMRNSEVILYINLDRGHMEWTALEWMHIDCLPYLIQLARFLPQKEDNLRTRITKVD